jgi:VWFA-related protein
VPQPAGVAQDAEKHVFVTVLGSDGAPLEGLTPEHFAVRESGKERPVVKVEPLRVPMHVAVLVDTSVGNGAPNEVFRSAVVDFVERLASFNKVAVYSFGDRAAAVTGFTQDSPQLRAAATAMFGWSHERSHLIDAVDMALRDLEKIETKRPVIIAITSESPEASRRTAGGVIKRLIAQSTAFHAIALTAASRSGSATGVNANIPASSQRLGGMIAMGEGDRERTQVLQQGTAATGGGQQRLTSTLALSQALARLARELSTSYLLTFTRPGSDKIKDLQVGIMVDGATLRATAAPFGTR